jgi:hypothetical protein
MSYIRQQSKNWFILAPSPRKKVIIPSKYPEELVKLFLTKLLTKEKDWVLDPFVGIGSTNIACAELDRRCVGVDIQELYIEFAKERLKEWCEKHNKNIDTLQNYLIAADSRNIKAELNAWFKNSSLEVPKFRLCITSPSYWRILQKPGKEFLEKCEKMQIPYRYYEKPGDLVKIDDYETYIQTLVDIFNQVFDLMDKNSFLVVVLKNIKKHRLAWDFATEFVETSNWRFFDEYIWCQDDVPLQPLSLGTYWNSTICHHYCLTFIKG